MCFFNRRCCCCQPTHTHTLLLSLCLSAILLFSPFFPFDIKTLATILSLSIEIQILPYSLVLISKVSSIQNLQAFQALSTICGKGQKPTLEWSFANIRQSWKGLLETNILAYLSNCNYRGIYKTVPGANLFTLSCFGNILVQDRFLIFSLILDYWQLVTKSDF